MTRSRYTALKIAALPTSVLGMILSFLPCSDNSERETTDLLARDTPLAVSRAWLAAAGHASPTAEVYGITTDLGLAGAAQQMAKRFPRLFVVRIQGWKEYQHGVLEDFLRNVKSVREVCADIPLYNSRSVCNPWMARTWTRNFDIDLRGFNHVKWNGAPAVTCELCDIPTWFPCVSRNGTHTILCHECIAQHEVCVECGIIVPYDDAVAYNPDGGYDWFCENH